jgi:hypothetical protein
LCGPRNRCHLCEKKLLNVGHVSARPRSKLERRKPSILEVKSCVIVGNEMLRQYCEGREEKRHEKRNQIHLCLDAMTEQRDRGSGARRSWALALFYDWKLQKKKSSDFDWIHHHRPHGLRDFSDILCSIKKPGPRLHHESILLRHGAIKPVRPVLPLYSFLRPSCFLDQVPYRHHQAQF